MRWIEAVAAALGLLCVWMTVRQNILCWPTGLAQVLLYAFIFYKVRLYSDLILHVIYVIMQIYGWYHWLHGGRDRKDLKVTVLSAPFVSTWIIVGVTGSLIWGYLMGTFTNASVPYADAFITVLSLIAQWLMARKKLESWYFWISVDLIAVGVYCYKQLFMTTGLYAVFLVLAALGYFEWRKTLQAGLLTAEVSAGVEA